MIDPNFYDKFGHLCLNTCPGGNMYAKSPIAKTAFLITLLSLILAACAAPAATSMPEPPPASPEVMATPTVAVEPTAEGSDLRPIEVADVQVEIGVGSPIPVNAIVSGTWPDLCAQVAQIEQTLAGSRFEVELQATPADENCPPDLLGLPFRIAVPLNMVEKPVGTYAVSVNGVETSFDWDVASSSGGTPAETQTGDLRPIFRYRDRDVARIAHMVDAVLAATVDPVCPTAMETGQRGQGRDHRWHPGQPGLPADNVGVAYRNPAAWLEMPRPHGVVNGVQTDFEWTATPNVPIPVENLGLTVSYVGADGNLWIADASGGPPRQVTSDAASFDSGGDVVIYNFPKISADGRFIAARRDAGGPPRSESLLACRFTIPGGESSVVSESTDPPCRF
jgi:hypothetical protein